jgi:hypothetical protein
MIVRSWLRISPSHVAEPGWEAVIEQELTEAMIAAAMAKADAVTASDRQP